MKVTRISIASSNKERSLRDIANVINDVKITVAVSLYPYKVCELHDIKPNLYKSELPEIIKKLPDSACHIQFFKKID